MHNVCLFVCLLICLFAGVWKTKMRTAPAQIVNLSNSIENISTCISKPFQVITVFRLSTSHVESAVFYFGAANTSMCTGPIKHKNSVVFHQLYGPSSQKRTGQCSIYYSQWIDQQSGCAHTKNLCSTAKTSMFTAPIKHRNSVIFYQLYGPIVQKHIG